MENYVKFSSIIRNFSFDRLLFANVHGYERAKAAAGHNNEVELMMIIVLFITYLLFNSLNKEL